MNNIIDVKILNTSNKIYKQTLFSAGYDIYANENVKINSHEYKLIKTGLYLQIQNGYEGQIRSRSGLAYKHGIIVLNSPGTIDSDYTGEIQVLLYNVSNESYTININDRIAQIVFSKCYDINLIETNIFNKTQRDNGGFGHTGK